MTTRATAARELEVVRVVPPGGEPHAYRLPVPRGWAYGGSVGKALELDTIARPLGTFVQADRSASIVVTVTPLPIEVRVEEWLADDLGRARWKLEQMKWHRMRGAPKLAVFARRDAHVRAIAAIPDGGRLYAVNVHAPANRAKEVADRLWWSAMAFSLCRPAGPGRLEGRQRVELGSHVFEAPVSWIAGARGELVLRHPSGVERGRIAVRVDRTTSGATPIDRRRTATLTRFVKRGLVLARTLEVPPRPWQGLPEGWELRGLAARNKAGDTVDLLLVHGTIDGVCVEVAAVGSRSTQRSWMRTARAVEIACETFAPTKART
ncbi:MAG TPA: hypothetical protein VG755_04750 [Nannocystaceae bacterium]|nr:hypothetical protein [Nannocystaceae bacterium]